MVTCMVQSAKAAGDASRSREAWRLGNALLQAARLDEAETLFKVSPGPHRDACLLQHGSVL